MKKAIIGIVESRADAELAVFNLRTAGILTDDVSVLLPDKSGSTDLAHEHGSKAPEAAVAGAGAGGVLGGTLGLLAGIGAVAIPGVGPLIAAGPLMAALSGFAAGAAVGGITGALVGFGIPEVQGKHYEGKVQGGSILIAVHVETSEALKMAETMLKQAGAHDISVTHEVPVPRKEGKEARPGAGGAASERRIS